MFNFSRATKWCVSTTTPNQYMPIYLKYLTVILTSSLKFVGGPLAGVALRMGLAETAICVSIGMMLTVILFVFLSDIIQVFINKYRTQKPKLFSRRSRYAVKIWQRFGMSGIAFLTPLLFTPIGGTLIAISFKVNKLKIVYSMLISAVFWAIVQTLFFFYLSDLKRFFD
jgi:uncharacterized membrane protein